MPHAEKWQIVSFVFVSFMTMELTLKSQRISKKYASSALNETEVFVESGFYGEE